MFVVTSPVLPDEAPPLTKSDRTRKSIAKAARELFATHDFADASVRAIAAKAGVDHSLVIRYFNSKEDLFLASVGFEGFFNEAMAGPLDGLGERLIAAILNNRHDGFGAYRALIRASGSEAVRRRLQEVTHSMFVEPLTPRLSGPDAELRARLVSAQIGGLIHAIAILEDTVIASTETNHLAKVYGASIQSLIGTNS